MFGRPRNRDFEAEAALRTLQVTQAMNRIWTLAVILLLSVFTSALETTPNSSNGQASKPDNDLCLACHADIGAKLKGHAHSEVACAACHTQHEDYPHPAGIPKPACGTCHANIVHDYSRSAHAEAARKGDGTAPDCATCHGTAHELESTKTAQFRSAIPDTCGACHSDIAEQYRQSIHGQAVAKGVAQAPVCTDCHGEHAILPPTNVASTVHPSHVRETCAGCHADVRLTRRFGLPVDRIISFDASFHGLEAKAGNQTVANCASCHGVHNILPSSDPRSTINPHNLPTTCGKCHAGAGTRFVLGRVHLVAGETGEPRPLLWVRGFYFLVIPLTVGFMALHNGGDWIRKLRRLRFHSAAAASDTITMPASQEIRMFTFERLEHMVMAASFIVLAWTGFALKYPDQWWAKPLLIWESSHSARGMIHRTASVFFMSAGLAHMLSLAISKDLRDHWKSLWPKRRDLPNAWQQLAFNLGLREFPPERYSHGYVEKVEYWALIWGSVIMMTTGLVLWANNLILKFLPKIVLDVATSFHFYEAVLATVAILVWHFYFVIFDPDVYPMDTAWLTGKSPRKEHRWQSADKEEPQQ